MVEVSPTDVPSPVCALHSRKPADETGAVFIAGHSRPRAGRLKAYDLDRGVEVFLAVLLRSAFSLCAQNEGV
jgi:hypothetical protein